MSKFCVKCNNEIHPKRVEILPNVSTCVDCASTGKYHSITQQLGEGDHTYNELTVITNDQYNKLENLKKSHSNLVRKSTSIKIESSDKSININNIEGDIL